MRREPFRFTIRSGSAESDAANDGLECTRCLQRRPSDELDRLLWCEACRETERAVAAIWGRRIGIAFGLGLTIWIALAVKPATGPLMALWAASILVVYRLATRLGRELIYGVARIRNVPGARAEPQGEA